MRHTSGRPHGSWPIGANPFRRSLHCFGPSAAPVAHGFVGSGSGLSSARSREPAAITHRGPLYGLCQRALAHNADVLLRIMPRRHSRCLLGIVSLHSCRSATTNPFAATRARIRQAFPMRHMSSGSTTAVATRVFNQRGALVLWSLGCFAPGRPALTNVQSA